MKRRQETRRDKRASKRTKKKCEALAYSHCLCVCVCATKGGCWTAHSGSGWMKSRDETLTCDAIIKICYESHYFWLAGKEKIRKIMSLATPSYTHRVHLSHRTHIECVLMESEARKAAAREKKRNGANDENTKDESTHTPSTPMNESVLHTPIVYHSIGHIFVWYLSRRYCE